MEILQTRVRPRKDCCSRAQRSQQELTQYTQGDEDSAHTRKNFTATPWNEKDLNDPLEDITAFDRQDSVLHFDKSLDKVCVIKN
ncbi:hypothetical protein E2C01_025736 [Portunus trituberculatus]|uniref:Uncharacterized protein n=1 Tax=Portunus trituberculatus TaxID=210409 RepID=A0A5B7EGI9_PORTR|nr:hypothetical protein [Portunus trituberculatus]